MSQRTWIKRGGTSENPALSGFEPARQAAAITVSPRINVHALICENRLF